ncbi:MAG: helix-turn-helix transcriptional regulator [Ruminococcus sp.]|nr:helix-turn-helix transcriptional regulator [Ruminococcus sp.]
MDINERVTFIREHEKMTITDFANELGLSKSSISLIEKGVRSLTERTKRDICNRFNVNLTWLETGEGDPFLESEEQIIRMLRLNYKLDDIDVEIIKGYLKLSPEERKAFFEFIKKIRDA